MEKLKVNDTPVRTARNFKINNIEVELDLPENEIQKMTDKKIDEIDKILEGKEKEIMSV